MKPRSPYSIERHRIPSGPTGTPLLGSLRELTGDPLGLFLEATIRFGGLVRFRVAHKHVYLVSEPDCIKHVLVTERENYVKGISYDSLRTVMGRGLLVADGEPWQAQRHLLQPLFHREALKDKVPTITACIGELCDRWDGYAETGETFDLVKEMMRLALDVVGRTLIGAETAGEMDAIERAMAIAEEYVYSRIRMPVKPPEWLPTSRRRSFGRSMRVFDGIVQRLVDEHASRGASDTMLGVLGRSQDPELPGVVSHRQVRDELLTFLLAGHETTGAALCWSWYLLAKHPNVLARLHQELDTVLGGRIPEAGDLTRLPYTGRVIDESMRLFPPAWALTRRALAEDEVGGYRIPAGAIVVISPYVNHHLPDYWEDPEAFDPDRFLPERVEKRPAFHFFPFGGGPHLCIGKYLTLFEVKLALAMLASRYELILTSREAPQPAPKISLRPKHPIVVRVKRRERESRARCPVFHALADKEIPTMHCPGGNP